MRPRRVGPAVARRSSEEEKKGTSDWPAEDGGGGAADGTPIASSCTGGSSMGRDMVTAARLITCVGKQCQAVSRGSVAGHPSLTSHCSMPGRRERGEKQARQRSFPRCEHGGAMLLCKARRRGRA